MSASVQPRMTNKEQTPCLGHWQVRHSCKCNCNCCPDGPLSLSRIGWPAPFSSHGGIVPDCHTATRIYRNMGRGSTSCFEQLTNMTDTRRLAALYPCHSHFDLTKRGNSLSTWISIPLSLDHQLGADSSKGLVSTITQSTQPNEFSDQAYLTRCNRLLFR